MFTRPVLPAKGTIGIVSPGMGVAAADLAEAKARLEKAGYSVVVHPQNYLSMGDFAGPDAARIEALMDMFADRTIDAIMCARGGVGCFRDLDALDYDFIKKNPKPFIGMSDVTVLLQALTQRTGMVTFHGPMAWHCAKAQDNQAVADSVQLALDVLEGQGQTYRFADAVCLRAGAAEGPLWGGCLALLQTMIGTPYEVPTEGALLFVEDYAEPLYKIDRMLGHLRQSGRLDNIKGAMIGQFTGRPADETPYGIDLREIVMEHLPPDVPIAMNVPCGHIDFNVTLPIGLKAYLTVTPQGSELSFAT